MAKKISRQAVKRLARKIAVKMVKDIQTEVRKPEHITSALENMADAIKPAPEGSSNWFDTYKRQGVVDEVLMTGSNGDLSLQYPEDKRSPAEEEKPSLRQMLLTAVELAETQARLKAMPISSLDLRPETLIACDRWFGKDSTIAVLHSIGVEGVKNVFGADSGMADDIHRALTRIGLSLRTL